MVYLEDARLTRESWREAGREGCASVLCLGCGASVEIEPEARFSACRSCEVVFLTPVHSVSPQNDQERPTKATLTPPMVSLIGLGR